MSTGEDSSGRRREQDTNDEQTYADVLNAFSFGNTRRRRKASNDPVTPPPETEQEPPGPADESIGQGLPVDVGQVPPVDFGQAAPVDNEPAWGPGNADPGAPAAAVRAYVWTGGRTKSRHHFEIETLVSAAVPSSGVMTQPHRTVLELCREPRSVAEVAALLAMPLGVAMVLLGDMTDQGLIVIHEAATTEGGAPGPTLIERVLTGLRQL